MNGGPDAALLAEIEAAAAEWAAAAGALLLSRFRTKLTVEFKSAGNKDPVTEADRAAETYLHDAIHARYPDHGVLGEEGADAARGADFQWVLDPLDGTTNFINGLPFWGVSVGVLYQGQPVAAAIYTPSSPHADGAAVFHARLGGGAYMNEARLRLPDDPEPTKARLSGLPGHYWRDMRFHRRSGPKLGEMRTLGSIALELALISAGVLQYGVFWEPKIWDVAAGVLLVREAGGRVACRSQKKEPWRQLRRFEPLPDGDGSLRTWKGSIIAGAPRVVRLIAEDVSARNQLLSPIGPLWRRISAEVGRK